MRWTGARARANLDLTKQARENRMHIRENADAASVIVQANFIDKYTDKIFTGGGGWSEFSFYYNYESKKVHMQIKWLNFAPNASSPGYEFPVIIDRTIDGYSVTTGHSSTPVHVETIDGTTLTPDANYYDAPSIITIIPPKVYFNALIVNNLFGGGPELVFQSDEDWVVYGSSDGAQKKNNVNLNQVYTIQ